MKKLQYLAVTVFAVILLTGCGQKKQEVTEMINAKDHQKVSERLAMYADVNIDVDMSMLTERERQLVKKLIEAGNLVDEIFWMQSSHDAITLRDSLMGVQDQAGKDFLAYVNINYGPYDRIFEGERFVGHGPARKPAGAGLYPEGLTKEEFEEWVDAHPDQKTAMESQYTVVVRDGDQLRAIPYHQQYPQTAKIAALLNQAADLADNPSLKKYLQLRAKAIASDDYFESDMAWMDLKENNIDVVIGPIENYEDGLFNYKTAFECAVVV
ncbi:MAG: peptidase, partial [Bacteroidota bacterium]